MRQGENLLKEKGKRIKNNGVLIKHIWKPVFLILVIFIAYMVLKDSWFDIWVELKETSYPVIAGVFLCSILYNCFDGAAIAKLLRSYDDKFPWYEGVLCSLYYSFFRVVTFGSGTAAAGMYYVRKRGVPVSRSMGVFTLNYVVQRVAVCLYFVLTFLGNYKVMNQYFSQYRGFMIFGVLLAVLIVTALIMVCVCGPLHNWVFSQSEKIMKRQKQKKKIEEWKENAVIIRCEANRLLKNKKLLLEILILNFLKLSAWFLIPAIIFYKMEFLNLSLLVGTTSMMMALAGVIPAPGGVGAVEFVFVSLFTPLTGNVEAVSGMLIYRFSTYIFPFLLGSLAALRNSKLFGGKD